MKNKFQLDISILRKQNVGLKRSSTFRSLCHKLNKRTGHNLKILSDFLVDFHSFLHLFIQLSISLISANYLKLLTKLY